MSDRRPSAERAQSLLHGAFAGDRAAEEALLRELLIPGVDAAVSRFCAGRAQRFFTREEWCQKVLLHLYEDRWAKLRRYDPARADLFAWLFGVTEGKIRDEIRRLDPPTPTADPERDAAHDEGPLDAALREEAWQRLLRALTPEEILLFRWFHAEGLERRQIAERMGWSMDLVYRKIQDLEKKVKHLLSNP